MKCLITEEGVRVVPSEEVCATDGYCRFEIKACGICGSDIPRVFAGTSYFYPIVLGHEFSGVVKDSTDKALVGRRACVFPILPCGECAFCQKQQWASCTHYDYYGSRRDGGMQSELLVKESNLVFLPDNVSFEAGAMIEPAAVCLHAVKKAGITGDSRVLVCGAGTIGLLCGMWARALGAAAVYFSDPDELRRETTRELGFALYDGEAVNIVVEASGAVSALHDAIAGCEALGKIVLVGHGKKDVSIPHDRFVQILRKQITLFGSWNSDFTDAENDWKESVQAIADGVIDPVPLITHRIPLARADEAFAIIGKQREPYNKIMVVT